MEKKMGFTTSAMDIAGPLSEEGVALLYFVGNGE